MTEQPTKGNKQTKCSKLVKEKAMETFNYADNERHSHRAKHVLWSLRDMFLMMMMMMVIQLLARSSYN